MEEDWSTPLFTPGEEIATFLASCGILSKAWKATCLASISESFILNEYEGVAYVAFPSFHNIEGFIVKESKYGEGNIQTDNKFFSGCLKGDDDQPASVHQGALKLFLHIMEKTDFQAKLQSYTDSRQRQLKSIIFAGHSLGGAIATLATLWVLEIWLLERRVRQSYPFCITFGCPLVGDERLVEAIGRENWAGNFLHVVSQHDIVPRMLLAPLESIVEPLTAILPYWHGEVLDSSIQYACKTLLNNVLQYTYTVANYGVDSFTGSDGVMKRSPYIPFGNYMFCSSHGSACMSNSDTVLKMLHLTTQILEKLSDNIVQDCILEHIRYDSVLKRVIENSSGRRSANPNSESSYKIGISLQLEAIGIGENDQAQLALLEAGKTENEHNINVSLSIELIFKKGTMAEIEWYKDCCEKEDGITYYDSFKSQLSRRDIEANLVRVKLARFWDEIIEMWRQHKLPSDFQSQYRWINAGNTYRKLVEPLDIAHYYLTSNEKGSYLSDGRPDRHKVLQKWMEDKEKTRRDQRPRTKRASLTVDSCFWAHVEEARKDLEYLKQGQIQRLQNLEEFEEYVTAMENSNSISSDVILEGSFKMWWEEWKEYKQNQFPPPLSKITESVNSPKFERIASFTVGQHNISSSGEEVKENIFSTKKVKEKISSSGEEVKENISSSAEVKENISSTKKFVQSDLAERGPREIELAEQRGTMFELELYKMNCHEKGDGYYDSFKNQMDTDPNLFRAKLGEFWDDITKRWDTLPSDFKSQNKWINAGTSYRKLVEPLDIAHYYGWSKASGNYLDTRPPRYKILQEWLEVRKKNRSSAGQKARTKLPFLTRDSCFWAHVEEALKDLSQGLHQKKESLQNFEGYVASMINDRNISSDVFLEKSSFMTWWQRYKQSQLQSPLYKLMESEFWK